jgi:hypothetical protein
VPAAWRVIVENGKVKVWQVYADSKIPFDIMNNAESKLHSGKQYEYGYSFNLPSHTISRCRANRQA